MKLEYCIDNITVLETTDVNCAGAMPFYPLGPPEHFTPLHWFSSNISLHYLHIRLGYISIQPLHHLCIEY